MKKNLWTLNIGNYAPEITRLTYPMLEMYAKKIGAQFRIIETRKFPDWPVVYEKLQIFERGQDADWNIYIDSDALVHRDMFDVTEYLSRDTVLHNGNDNAGNRWKFDRFFRRDGRHIGSCNWFTVASSWCIDLWEPSELTPAEAIANITLTQNEVNSGVMDAGHLVDDYTLSRNIAKYGLKFISLIDLKRKIKDRGDYLYHQYTLPVPQKVEVLQQTLVKWKAVKLRISF